MKILVFLFVLKVLFYNQYGDKYAGLFRVFSLEENVGLGKALNYGVQCCKYDLIARMDTDDIAVPNRFELQKKSL